MKPGLRFPTRVLLLTAAYFLGGLLGKSAAFMEGNVALVWPPAGIALAAILLFGYRFLPGVFIGAILFATLDGKPLGFFTFGTAIGNCVGAMICAYMLRQTVKFENSFQRLRDAVAFVVLASVLSTSVNALFNVASLYIGSSADWTSLGDQFFVWWVPNAMGCLVVTPLLLCWSEFTWSRWSVRQWIEALACWGGMAVALLLSFESWFSYSIDRYPLAYLPYPFLVWSGLRFGVRGATLGTLMVSGASLHALLEQRGPFVTNSPKESLLLIGSYIAVLAIANLLLAASAAERARTQRTLRESEGRYRAVVEDQTEAICRFDRAGFLTFVNDAFCRSRGKRRADLIGTSFLPQVSAADMEIPLIRFLQLNPENPVLSYDARMVNGDGTAGWEQCSVRALFDEKNRVAEFQMVSQDITLRKQTEEALRSSEEKIKAILVDGIVTLDEKGGIISCNPAAERIFGLSAFKLAGRTFALLMHEQDREKCESALHTIQAKPLTDIELRAVRPGGETFPINLSISTLAVNRRPGYMVVVRDMTERKQVQEQLLHAQKLETVGHLAGGVAHDFNNLLSIIIGHVSLMVSAQNATGKVAQSAQQILKAAERGARLTRQLLMFSRRQYIQTKLLDFNDTVRELTKMLGRVLGENIELEVQYAPLPLMLQADEGMLDQVIMNLAVNARDAMPKAGRLVISTGRREVGADECSRHPDASPGAFATLTVTDSGSGIPPEVLPRIFEPFFTTKEVGKGTGLGLSTVYGIVRQHKGWIEVLTEIGKGTTFEIVLPLASSVQPALSTLAPCDPVPGFVAA